MQEKLNSAHRIKAILHAAKNTQAAKSAQGKRRVIDAWAEALNVRTKDDNIRSLAVSERLIWMAGQLETAESQMKRTEFSESLYKVALTKVRLAISPMILGSNWDVAAQYLLPETMQALAFISEILPDEEAEISDESIREIEASLEELLNAAHGENVPESLAELISHHIDLIYKALQEYPILGARALRLAGQAALGEIVENQAVIEENTASPAVEKLKATWRKVNTVADTALKAERIVQLTNRTQEFLSQFFP